MVNVENAVAAVRQILEANERCTARADATAKELQVVVKENDRLRQGWDVSKGQCTEALCCVDELGKDVKRLQAENQRLSEIVVGLRAALRNEVSECTVKA